MAHHRLDNETEAVNWFHKALALETGLQTSRSYAMHRDEFTQFRLEAETVLGIAPQPTDEKDG